MKKAKKEANDKELSAKEKKELPKRKKNTRASESRFRKKLIKFATRVPIFMYLTDYRERCRKDVHHATRARAFQKSDRVDRKRFRVTRQPGVFNSALMNDAVYKFKRYEDASLVYTG